jgi:hypothetical protein
MFLRHHQRFPNLKNPELFNEKILYLKMYQKSKLKKKIVDRFLVRGYVSKYSKNCNLTKILWIGKYINFDEWINLPEIFVIKANHGSGMTKIVNKENDNRNELNYLINKWISNDYSKFEKIYEDNEKVVIIEECLLDSNYNIPRDFKFFCFNGEVKLIQVDSDRFEKHNRNLYTPNFELVNLTLKYPNGAIQPKPKHLDKAMGIAKELSRPFDFIRVDLYILENDIYFGELTCYPGGAFEKFKPKCFDKFLGKFLNIKS